MGATFKSIDGVVGEIMALHRSLPPRPTIDEVEAAMAVVRNVETEENAKLESIQRQTKGFEIPDELFFVMQEMQKSLVYHQSKEQKQEALKLLDLENLHDYFDELIQRASQCVPSSSNGTAPSSSTGTSRDINGTTGTSSNNNYSSFSSSSTAISPSVFNKETQGQKSSVLVTRDDSYVKKAKGTIYPDGIVGNSIASRAIPAIPVRRTALTASSGEDGEKLSLIKLASAIEISAKKGSKELNLQNKLSDQIEWLPDSIGKLSTLISLDLSENRILELPLSIGGLSSLKRLNLSSNRISKLPDSIGDLFNLLYLDLKGNQLTSLNPNFGKLIRLEELDLNSNNLSSLPDSIGNLTKLKKLFVETNNLEELPYTIGHCVSLVELRADYNKLRGLPEAVGKMEFLEVLSVRYNNLKGLPTTMSQLTKIKEINASFNELESVPESLCLATSLVKLNVGNNFADLRFLPKSIGNLENLEELDISNNQIRVLPDSFGLLGNLRVLHVEENPLEIPPRHIADLGAQAVVEYMIEYVAKREMKKEPTKTKKNWSGFCFFKSRPNKRKHDRLDTVT
ncbi:hypothetical protein LUZ60_003385 [Juncus effusus]|nr:hypothetical protein LUZ60_003385 [Juncus effusus]